jgi:hypothetical protein
MGYLTGRQRPRSARPASRCSRGRARAPGQPPARHRHRPARARRLSAASGLPRWDGSAQARAPGRRCSDGGIGAEIQVRRCGAVGTLGGRDHAAGLRVPHRRDCARTDRARARETAASLAGGRGGHPRRVRGDVPADRTAEPRRPAAVPVQPGIIVRRCRTAALANSGLLIAAAGFLYSATIRDASR